MNKVIEEISALNHFREFKCADCNHEIKVHVLKIHAICPNCGAEKKCRGFGSIGTEIEDVIDAVLEWVGQGESFESVLERHQEITNSRNLN